MRRSRRDLAALLAVEAHRRRPGPATAAALLGVVTAALGFLGYLPLADGPARSGAPLPDGRTLLTAGPDGQVLAVRGSDGGVWLVDVPARVVLGGPIRHQSRVEGLALRPDGGELAVDSGDGLMMWVLRTEAWAAAV